MKWGMRKIIGLDIDEGAVAAAELIKNHEQFNLNRAVVVSNLKELSKDPAFKEGRAIINLPAQVVLFRSFHVVSSLLKSKNREKDIIAFLSRQNLPFKLEECFWGTFALDSNLSLIAAKKEVVEKYIAQVQESGLRVWGATASLIALYNVLIYTYREREKDRFALLNIRTASSDLLIYEAKRLWVYPLSIGKRDLDDSGETLGRFSIEVQRTFNAHYLQNPSIMQKAPNYFYLAGQGCSAKLATWLKNALGDFEIILLEPLQRIGVLNTDKEPAANPQGISLSIGLGLTYLESPSCLKINLIQQRVKKVQFIAYLNTLKKAGLSFMVLVMLYLFVLDLKLIKGIRSEAAINKNTAFEISSVLPSIKALNEEKQKLQKLKGFFDKKLNQQRLYLKALSAISESRPSSVVINELNAQMNDASLEVILSGVSSEYQEINIFLSKLKKNEDLKEVKVVASSFSNAETDKAKEIDFKLRFNATDASIKAEEEPENVAQIKPKPKEVLILEKKSGGK